MGRGGWGLGDIVLLLMLLKLLLMLLLLKLLLLKLLLTLMLLLKLLKLLSRHHAVGYQTGVGAHAARRNASVEAVGELQRWRQRVGEHKLVIGIH